VTLEINIPHLYTSFIYLVDFIRTFSIDY